MSTLNQALEGVAAILDGKAAEYRNADANSSREYSTYEYLQAISWAYEIAASIVRDRKEL